MKDDNESRSLEAMTKTRTKLLLGLSVALCALATAATPALAWFESTNPEGQGEVQSAGPVAFRFPGGTVVECESAQGEYHIQARPELQTEDLAKEFYKDGKHYEEQVKQKFQAKTNPGPHIELALGSSEDVIMGEHAGWHKCKDTILGMVVPARIRHCNLQIEQELKNPGEQVVTDSIMKDCVIEQTILGMTCVIKFAHEANQHLARTTLRPEPPNIRASIEQQENLTYTVNPVCEMFGLPGGVNGSFGGVFIIHEAHLI